ncbi:MAG: hypothetical protein PWP23_2208 [Candidatus Sumerlaeota bacterium]|nr:hypothetical protein [Candidatus Sumerlaeota bacterium]
MKKFFKKDKPEEPERQPSQPENLPVEEEKQTSPEEDAYLSRLANSVLKKEPFPYKERRAGSDRQPVGPGTPLPVTPKTNLPSPPRNTPLPARHTPLPTRHTPLPTRHTPMPVSQPQPDPQTPAPPQNPRARMTPLPVARRQRMDTPVLGLDGTFAVGTILHFEDNSIGIYRDIREDKDYEVVYLLRPDGSVSPQGIALENYDLKVIGQLPPEFMLRLQRRRRWERDEIIYHLDIFDYCALVPFPTGKMTTPVAERDEPIPPAAEPVEVEPPKKLVLGRKITVNFGANRKWEAVYWGEDELGPVIAHNTHDKWALMHLDLSRFGDGVVLQDMASPELLDIIRRDISQ